MSDEVRATNFGGGCCDGGVGGGWDNNWIEWIVIIFVICWLFGGGNSWFGRGGCCR